MGNNGEMGRPLIVALLLLKRSFVCLTCFKRQPWSLTEDSVLHIPQEIQEKCIECQSDHS